MNNSSRIFASVIVGVLSTAVVLGGAGCGPKKSQKAAPLTPATRPATGPDVRVQFRSLQERVTAFSVVATELPGPTEQTHRQLLARAFAELGAILPILQGPNPPGVFNKQMQIVQGSRQTLATAPLTQDVQPAIDSGLRATYNALAAIAQRDFPQQKKISDSLAQFQASIDQLDTVRGPLHRVVTADAAGHVAELLQGMATVMEQRLPALPSTTAPATQATTTRAVTPAAPPAVPPAAKAPAAPVAKPAIAPAPRASAKPAAQ